MTSVTFRSTTFRPVFAYATRTSPCPVCGKRSIRRRYFEHTVNPYNRNEDGTVKTSAEVRADAKREADAWVPDFTHARCADESAS